MKLWTKLYIIFILGAAQFCSGDDSKLYVFNISSVVELQRWWVLKSKIFGQESTYSKEIFKKNWSMNDGSSQSAQIILLKSIFDVKNQPNFSFFFI